jgi:hypothetical protein
LEKMAELYKSGKLAQIVKWTKEVWYARFICHLYTVPSFVI